MYLSIIFLPLLASLASGFFGRKIGVTGAQIISTTSIFITSILACVGFFEVGFNNIPVTIEIFKWINSESLYVLWAFNFDSLTVSMLIPVLIVSCLVHLYSIGYMGHDPHNQRFFSYLSLFTFMMIILVTANSYLLMFVGWEGVGICSYLLVSFWFTRIAANQSSMSAFLTNRVGDCFLTIGIFAMLWTFGNVDYSTVFSLAPYINENIITIIGICLLIGAMAKSSQLGLHIWLPQAMEGPTPVSALIHAATMVTAGVYLLMRSSPLIEYSSTVLVLSLWLGALTTIFSSLVGLFQQDIKKVIAYSTMSQLGMMVIAIGLSSYSIALFHLINHAFYKALLFLGAGSVIHSVSDNQDFRKYGGLRVFLPLTYSVMLIASLSLIAFPFMTGYYSKDLIIESAFGHYNFTSMVVYIVATIAAMFTTLYSVKVLYVTFLSNPAGPRVDYENAHESDIYMSIPLIILAVFSIFFGFITKDLFIGLGTNLFADNGIFSHPDNETLVNTEFSVPTIIKLLPFILTIFLITISIVCSEYMFKLLTTFKFTKLGYNLFSFFNQRFYIELFYNNYIVEFILKLGGQTTKVLDKGSIELIGPYGLEVGLISLSKSIGNLSTQTVTTNALYILVGLVSYITIPYLGDNVTLIILIYCLFSVVAFSYKFKAPVLPFKPLESKPLFSFEYLAKNWKINLKVAMITLILFKLPFKGLIPHTLLGEYFMLCTSILCFLAGMIGYVLNTNFKSGNNVAGYRGILLAGLISFTCSIIIILFIHELNLWMMDYITNYLSDVVIGISGFIGCLCRNWFSQMPAMVGPGMMSVSGPEFNIKHVGKTYLMSSQGNANGPDTGIYWSSSSPRDSSTDSSGSSSNEDNLTVQQRQRANEYNAMQRRGADRELRRLQAENNRLVRTTESSVHNTRSSSSNTEYTANDPRVDVVHGRWRVTPSGVNVAELNGSGRNVNLNPYREVPEKDSPNAKNPYGMGYVEGVLASSPNCQYMPTSPYGSYIFRPRNADDTIWWRDRRGNVMYLDYYQRNPNGVAWANIVNKGRYGIYSKEVRYTNPE